MGMFGQAFKNAILPGDQPPPVGGIQQSNWADKLMTIGAIMSDAANANGPQYSMALAKQRKEQALLANKMAAQQQLSGLFGGQAAGQGMGGPNLRDPRVQQALLLAEANGVDVGTALEIMKSTRPEYQVDTASGETFDKYDPSVAGRRFARPDVVEGLIIDKADPQNLERYIPKLGEGMTYQRDATGRAVGVQNAPGYVDALSQSRAAAAGAEAAAKSPYEFQSFEGPQGQTVTGARSALAGRVFQGQSAADKIRVEGEAKTQAEGRANLGQALQQAELALDVIGQIRNHPGRQSRLGLTAMLPAIPGTAGKDFDALVEQAKGQVFLQATQALRGLGPMTEQEGKAATSALARLNQAQSPEGFMKALDDFERIIQGQVSKARSKAGVAQPSADQAREELRRRGLLR